ncbi:hypothetical protein FRC11_006421 [Ceratobasidium sp. 423]|nr:hypothetical protein FRC11_006421 [Ceratobasidium sp. 423]
MARSSTSPPTPSSSPCRSPRLPRIDRAPGPLYTPPRRPAIRKANTYQAAFDGAMRRVFGEHRRRHTGIDIGHRQSGTQSFRDPLGSPSSSKSATWSFTPRSGISRVSAKDRSIGDIHFSLLPCAADATFYVCVPQGSYKQGRWLMVERGFEHPLYSSYVLYQRD